MSQIPCQYPDCTYVAEHASEAVAISMFSSHVVFHQQSPTIVSAPAKQKVPPIERPEIKQDVNAEDWATFLTEWSHFKRCTEIPADDVADQLFQCCERSLGRLLIRENPDIIAAGENELLKAMESMAVIKVATSVRRANLLATKQDHGESFREFYANVKSAASTCEFSIKCPNLCCAERQNIDYTSIVVKDILIAGIADSEIRKDVLGWPELDTKTDKEVVTFVEEKEMAKKAWSGRAAGAASMSGYKKLPQNEDTDVKKKLTMKGKCSKCSAQISLYTRYRSGKLNRTPFQMCIRCFRERGSRDNVTDGHDCNSGKKPSDGASESTAITSFIGAVNAQYSPMSEVMQTPLTGINSLSGQLSASKQSVVLDHHIFTPGGWKKVLSFTHPTLRLRISTCKEDYLDFGIMHPKIAAKHIDVVADSGAQSCLWSRKEFLKSGFSMKDLIHVHHTMKAANTAPISIDGAIIIRLSGNSMTGETVEAAVMTNISTEAKSFLLSKEALIQLRIIPHNASHTENQQNGVSEWSSQGNMMEDLEGLLICLPSTSFVSEKFTPPNPHFTWQGQCLLIL